MFSRAIVGKAEFSRTHTHIQIQVWILSCVHAAAVTENRPSVRERARARKEETLILTVVIALCEPAIGYRYASYRHKSYASRYRPRYRQLPWISAAARISQSRGSMSDRPGIPVHSTRVGVTVFSEDVIVRCVRFSEASWHAT